jgi:hypothetical protein
MAAAKSDDAVPATQQRRRPLRIGRLRRLQPVDWRG